MFLLSDAPNARLLNMLHALLYFIYNNVISDSVAKKALISFLTADRTSFNKQAILHVLALPSQAPPPPLLHLPLVS